MCHREIFYVYVYLSPKECGHYCYKNISFLYKPFYIGKGKEKRYLDFLNHNKFCQNKVKKILKDTNVKPIVVLIRNKILEQEAFDLEK